MKRLLLAILVVATTSCAFASPHASALPLGCDSWGHLPVTVAMDDGAGEYRDDVQRGMDAWAKAMHQPTFAWAPAADADVLVTIGETAGERTRGEHWAACVNGRVLSTVVLQEGMDVSKSTAFAAHELGHALGVGHSTNEKSIMHASISPGLMGLWDDDHEPHFYRILDSDARLAIALHAGVMQAGTLASAPDIDKDPGGFASSILNAAKSGKWRLLAGLLLIAVVWAARKWGAKILPWLKTDRGGALLVLLLAEVGGVATTLAGDAPFSWSLLLNSLSMAFTAAGGYALVRKLLWPSDAAKKDDGDTGVIITKQADSGVIITLLKAFPKVFGK